MNIIELIIISISLAMDASSASICKGLKEKKINIKNSFIVGGYFSLFQTLMPIIGYFLGNLLCDKIKFIDHFIAFFLLVYIGISMIKEVKENKQINNEIKFKEMIVLSIATSIDSLVIGITLSFLTINIWKAVFIIGTITFILTTIAYNIGSYFGTKYQKKAQIAGGLILIIMGLKILIDHLI